MPADPHPEAGETAPTTAGGSKGRIKRRDTVENRAFWDHVERCANYVNSHALCFTTWCYVTNTNVCAVCVARAEARSTPGGAHRSE